MLLLGAALRLPLLSRDSRFQVDEALYATIARQVTTRGDLYLINTVIDKPPLLFWAMAGSFALFGVSEFSARLPDALASVITLALLYALARRLYHDRRLALIAALLLAVSPFDRAFAATAFTDPLLTLWVIGGCLLAVRGRPGWAGIALALAFATKPSALQWLPLAMALLISQHTHWQTALRGTLRLIVGFVAGLVPLLIWSATRAVIPDFWTLNLYNNNPGRLIRRDELLPRLLAWSGWLNTIAPLPVIGWLSAPSDWLWRRKAAHGWSRAGLIDLLLTGYTLGSLALWWLVAFPVYDRYLHTLTPLLLLLCARLLLHLRDRFRWPPLLLIGIVLASPLLTARLPVTGEPADVAGIDRIAAFLDSLPVGTVVYNYSLGWELGFYLGSQAPIALTWQPTVDDLITAVSAQPGYWVAPRAEAERWGYLLRTAGISGTTTPLYAAGSFVMYYLVYESPYP